VRFSVEVKTNGEQLERGDLFYEKRRLYRVERVSNLCEKERTCKITFRLLCKINLDRQLREDRA
jgi:hypothetical protein